jgi:hypothetical protein
MGFLISTALSEASIATVAGHSPAAHGASVQHGEYTRRKIGDTHERTFA